MTPDPTIRLTRLRSRRCARADEAMAAGGYTDHLADRAAVDLRAGDRVSMSVAPDACRAAFGRDLTMGERACIETHRRIWLESIDFGRPLVIVEDDAVPLVSYDRLMAAIPDLPPDVPRVWYSYPLWPLTPPGPVLRRGPIPSIVPERVPAGTHCYAITPAAAERMMPTVATLPLDEYIRDNGPRLGVRFSCAAATLVDYDRGEPSTLEPDRRAARGRSPEI